MYKKVLGSLAVIALTACGGSGGGSAGGGGTSEAGQPQPQTGVFVDAEVANIGYRTESQKNKRTNSAGEFHYLPGETVTFFIGDVTLPAVETRKTITPLDMADSGDINDPVVVNIARLLQALDDDPGTDGISLSDAAHSNAAGLSVAFDSVDFDSEVTNLVANGSDGVQTSLPSEADAKAHLQSTLDRIMAAKTDGFDAADLDGTLYKVHADKGEGVVTPITFDADEGTLVIGGGTGEQADYAVSHGDQVIEIRFTSGPETGNTHYLVFSEYLKQRQAYRVCGFDQAVSGDEALAQAAAGCDDYLTTGLSLANTLRKQVAPFTARYTYTETNDSVTGDTKENDIEGPGYNVYCASEEDVGETFIEQVELRIDIAGGTFTLSGQDDGESYVIDGDVTPDGELSYSETYPEDSPEPDFTSSGSGTFTATFDRALENLTGTYKETSRTTYEPESVTAECETLSVVTLSLID